MRAALLFSVLCACGSKDDPGDDAGDIDDADDGGDEGGGDEGGGDEGGGDEGGGDEGGGDDGGVPLTLELPAASPSEGHERAADCDWELSADYECSHANPAVLWHDVPEGTAALLLVVDDPETDGFPQWSVVNIPPTATGLDAGISGEQVDNDVPDGAYELPNGSGSWGYLGACHPYEAHVYRWRVWALAAPLDAGLSSHWEAVTAAEELALDVAEACHIYGPRTTDGGF